MKEKVKLLLAERNRILQEMDKTSRKNVEGWIRDAQYCFLKSDLKKVEEQLRQLNK